LQRDSLDFSFAGLKTAVRTHALKLEGTSCEQPRADLAASTQEAIVDVLVRKTIAALQRTGCSRLVVAGGVGANTLLRARLRSECAKRQARVYFPELALCTDNGAMIALTAALKMTAPAGATNAFTVKPRWDLAA
jgi:N6-L-threonylcarbamoyladenine synthase